MKRFFLMIVWACGSIPALTQKDKTFRLSSPAGHLEIMIRMGEQMTWSVIYKGQAVITPSAISLQLDGGEIIGNNPVVKNSRKDQIRESFSTVAYKKAGIGNHCNQLTFYCRGDYGIIFRAYDDGAAYRLFTTRKNELMIRNEQVEFNFDSDYTAFIPHTSDLRGGDRYSCSFEEFYTETPLSKFGKDTLAYLPLLVALKNDRKAVLLEADVQDYPAMFVQPGVINDFGIRGLFAPYPLEEKLGGFNNINYMVTRRADYVAKVRGSRNFPWRIIVVSEQDKDLLNNDIVQCLSEPCKIGDPSWLKPGKVAWDWWNNWNISHVDFRAGINTATYKYYIDFAAANHLEYIILDEGWSDDWDLNKLKPEIDLAALLEYGKEKEVGLILWSTWYALSRDIGGLCAKYAAMGVKGFKVDFLDRNDQKMIASCYEMASIAAQHRLMLDFHGMFPPQGLQRTWPNVVNFEGVRGMEYMKWSADQRVPAHEVTIPFIRMIAGPMDYTPGAMRNTTKGTARPSNSLPVSMGTRCRQLAMYIVYEAPLQMLADNPSAYIKEQIYTDFLAGIPTVFDETIALDGKVGEYVVIARKKNGVWYVGAMTNWDARDIAVDLSFVEEGEYELVLFKDGVNADRDATDYKGEIQRINSSQELKIHLAPGGGFAMRLIKL